MRLLPELRKASHSLVELGVRIGTIDCTAHVNACQKAGVGSYPTSIVFNASRTNAFVGYHSADELVQFVEV